MQSPTNGTTALQATRTDHAVTDLDRLAAMKAHLALNRRLQVVASNEMLEEFEAWVVTVEAGSVGDLLRRGIYLLGRMVEAGIDPHRQEGQPRRSARFGILLSGASMDRLKQAAEIMGTSMSQACCVGFLWYKEVARAQLDGEPYMLRGRHGEVDCTRFLLP